MKHIQNILTQLSQEKDIQILYACETGSRAWGFPSPDSDYDIRFIYMHKRDWYLSLNEQKDTIEQMVGDFDVTGWDIRKCLHLLKKSNAPLIERFQSPIEYMSDEGFRDEFKNLIAQYYSPIAVFYHHYSLATNFWEDLTDKEEIKLKSFFYLVRSLLSCNWIIHDDTVLPMQIEGLMKYIDDDLKNRFRELIKLKATVGEKYLHKADVDLFEWIKTMFEKLALAKDNIKVNNEGMGSLNEFFIKMFYAKANN
jgi:uncharacterized protein